MAVYTRKVNGKDGKVRITGYYYKFVINGQTYWKAVKWARNLTQAREEEAKAKAEVYSGTYESACNSPLIGKFIDDVYLPWARENKASWERDEDSCKVIKAYFAGKRLSNIKTKHVSEFVERRRRTPVIKGNQLKATPRRPATVNREFSVLSKIFTIAVRKGKLKSNPCHGVEALAPDNATLRWLSVEEERRLMSYLVGEREHLRPVVVLLIHTGMRRSELLTLRRYQVNFDNETITLPKTKTPRKSQTRSRVVPMNSLVREETAKLCQGLRELEHIFTNGRTQERLKDPKRGFATACRKAGISGMSIHKLRHTFGSRLAEAGESLHRIAELMGHSDIRTTMKYVHAVAAGKHEAVERLVGYREGNRCRIVAEAKEQAS